MGRRKGRSKGNVQPPAVSNKQPRARAKWNKLWLSASAVCLVTVIACLWLVRPRFREFGRATREPEVEGAPSVGQPGSPVPTAVPAQAAKASSSKTGNEVATAAGKTSGSELSAPPADPPESSVAEIGRLQKQALEVSTALVEDFPDNPDALRVAGLVYKSLGKKSKAADAWKKALKLDPSRTELYVFSAEVAELQGQHEKAADLCRTGLVKAAPTPALFHGLAKALDSLGKLDDAVTVLLRAVELFPNDAESHQLLGKTYAMLDRQEKAKASYETALKLQPGNGTSLYGLVMACAKLGLEEQSKPLFDQVRKMAAENRAMVQGMPDVAWHRQILAVTCGDAAMVYAGERRLKKAEELIRRATVLAPANTAFLMRLAAILVAANRGSEAIPVCEEVIAHEPKNPVHHMALAEIYARLGRYSEASTAAKKAVDLKPEDAEYRRILGELEARR